MSKLIVYLDQNFISDMAKFDLEDKQDKVKPALKDIFSEIKNGVDEEKFLSPDSWIHAIETAAKSDPALRKAIHSYQGYLGQVTLRDPWAIKSSQFISALLNWCEIKLGQQDPWRLAFRENPNKRMENFKVSVPMPNLGLAELDSASIKKLSEIRRNGISADDQYKKEMETSRQHYKHLLKRRFISVLRRHNISIQKAEKFIDSHEFTQIPNIDLFCQLWSKNLANKERNDSQLGHDYNDIEFLAAYLPYCDVIATDKYMKSILQELKLDKKYSCRLYTMRDTDLQEMNTLLKEERIKRQPANKSLFSVLCVMLESKPTYKIDFLKKISEAQTKFQSTGKYWNKEIYTSVFLVYSQKDKIEMPDLKKVRKLGSKAFTADQWAEQFIFMSNFKKVFNTENKNFKELVSKLPAHLRGVATAVIVDEAEFNNNIFYVIEEAIKKKIDFIPKHEIPIIYT